MSSSTTKPEGAPKTGGSGSVSFSHTDFTYVRRKRKLIEEEEMGELNIVPYLDILVNLIMFLLVTQATLVSLGLIDVTAPSYTDPTPSGGQAQQGDENLRLTIGIAQQGFFIAAKGGVLPGEAEAPAEGEAGDGMQRREPTVPRKPDGSYDYPTLTVKLRAIKTAFPKAASVYVAADDNVPYEVVVRTLDASREDARGPLFPAVAFSQIN